MDPSEALKALNLTRSAVKGMPAKSVRKYTTLSMVRIAEANAPDLPPVNGAAFFLGFDPYTSNTTFITSGTGDVSIGLSDRPEVIPDHDFQDLSVKVSIVAVPEPGTLALAVRRRHVQRKAGFSLSRIPTG
jgi:hypothetical protein